VSIWRAGSRGRHDTQSAGSALKERARAAIEKDRGSLIGLAHDIHAHPQLAFAEEYAAARISEYLERHALDVRRGVYGMATGFVASYGKGRLHPVLCRVRRLAALRFVRSRAEGVRRTAAGRERRGRLRRTCLWSQHIAGAAVAAATGLCDLGEELGLRVSVFGAPAEELIGLPDPPGGHDAPESLSSTTPLAVLVKSLSAALRRLRIQRLAREPTFCGWPHRWPRWTSGARRSRTAYGVAAPHSIGFTTQADSALGCQAMLDAGVALAWKAFDAATEPALRAYLTSKQGTPRAGTTPSAASTVAVKDQVHAAINHSMSAMSVALDDPKPIHVEETMSAAPCGGTSTTR
jgi:hypothetical protein